MRFRLDPPCRSLRHAVTALVGCNAETSRYPARAYAPIPTDTLALMAQKGRDRNAPVLVRAYKKESEIEIWKQATNGQYVAASRPIRSAAGPASSVPRNAKATVRFPRASTRSPRRR